MPEIQTTFEAIRFLLPPDVRTDTRTARKAPEALNRESPVKGKPIYIHFFIEDCDWFSSDYDDEDLFFDYAIIGNPAFAEWGYISFTEQKNIGIPPGIEVDCELFAPPLKAQEIEEIRTT